MHMIITWELELDVESLDEASKQAMNVKKWYFSDENETTIEASVDIGDGAFFKFSV